MRNLKWKSSPYVNKRFVYILNCCKINNFNKKNNDELKFAKHKRNANDNYGKKGTKLNYA